MDEVLERVRVDPAGTTPVYVQIRDGLRREIASGRLREGDPLPTLQSIAQRYGISTKTVMQAFSELSAEGAIITRRGRRGCVAECRAPSTEIVLFMRAHAVMSHERQAAFFTQLTEGLRQGFCDPDRRFWMTFLGHGERTTVAEMLGVCGIRRCDGIVAYRPDPDAIDLLRGMAHKMPVCTLFFPVGDAVDCVEVAPAAPLRQLLTERIAQGKRHFTFAGYVSREPECFHSASPYIALQRETVRILDEAGIRCHEDVRPLSESNQQAQREALMALPEGAVVVAGNPWLSMSEDGRALSLDVISYTESRQTVEKLQGHVDFLYGGVELVSKAAVRLLRARAADMSAPARVERLEPEIIRRRAPVL